MSDVIRVLSDHNKENAAASRYVQQQGKAEQVVSKKDAKIRQLIESNNKLKLELKKSMDTNTKLENEKIESQKISTEMRSIIDQFQRQLEHATADRDTVKSIESMELLLEKNEQELNRYKKQVSVLTRALAVTAVENGVEGDLALSRGEESWRESQLINELERLHYVHDELEVTKQELEIAKVKLFEKDRLENELTTAKIEIDKLLHEILSLESRLRLMSEERDKAEASKCVLEHALGELRVEIKRSDASRDEKLREYVRKSETIQLDFVALESASNKHRLRVQELELLLEERDRREKATGCEISLMKSALTDFDEEIRRLAASLNAEAEANENLTTRLARVEGELDAANLTLAQMRRRVKDLESDLVEGQKAKSQVEIFKRDSFKFESQLKDQVGKISELTSSRDMIKQTLGSEIDRLTQEIKLARSESHNLKEKCANALKERDRFKALLASDTLARLTASNSRPSLPN